MQPPSRYISKTLGGNTSSVLDATYFALHIRRGDFQYKHTRLSGDEILSNIRHLLDKSVTNILYIATDETDKGFFQPFLKEFRVVFLADVMERADLAASHFNKNHVGMVEQVVCANAHTFVGTPLSSFTGYITRMRGYYRDGRYKRTYYTLTGDMYQLQERGEIIGPFWAREFQVAHKDIDDDGIVPRNRSIPAWSVHSPHRKRKHHKQHRKDTTKKTTVVADGNKGSTSGASTGAVQTKAVAGAGSAQAAAGANGVSVAGAGSAQAGAVSVAGGAGSAQAAAGASSVAVAGAGSAQSSAVSVQTKAAGASIVPVTGASSVQTKAAANEQVKLDHHRRLLERLVKLDMGRIEDW